MAGFLLTALGLVSLYVFICIIRPMRPFKNRKQALLAYLGVAVLAGVIGSQQEASGPATQVAANPAGGPAGRSASPAPMSPEEEKQRLAFCEYQHAGNAMMGQYQSIDAREAALEPLKRRYFADRGLEYEAVMRQAIAGTWDFECFEGRVVYARSPVGTIYSMGTPPSVKKVIKALEDDYVERKNRVVSCAGEHVGDVYYVLCEPSGLFIVSANNGPPFVTPLNGQAQADLEGVRMLRGPDGAGVPVQSLDEAGYRRWSVKEAMPIADVLKKF